VGSVAVPPAIPAAPGATVTPAAAVIAVPELPPPPQPVIKAASSNAVDHIDVLEMLVNLFIYSSSSFEPVGYAAGESQSGVSRANSNQPALRPFVADPVIRLSVTPVCSLLHTSAGNSSGKDSGIHTIGVLHRQLLWRYKISNRPFL